MTLRPVSGSNVIDAHPSHQAFLKVLAGALWEKVWIAAGNVSEVAANAHWGGLGFAKSALPALEWPKAQHLAQYFSICAIDYSKKDLRLKAKRPSRQIENFVAGFCLAFDDVGTKYAAADIVAFMGGPPTAALTSSTGNEQWFYRLQVPCLDAIRYKAAHVALGLRKLTDAGGINPVRYMRLPGGINGKPAYGEDPSKHPVVKLTVWNPNVSVEPGFFDALVDEGLASPAMVTSSTGSSCADLSNPDPVLRQLMELGWVRGADQSDAGAVQIRCPFVAEHTGGEVSGTKYLGGGRVFCHHGHCFERNGWGRRRGEFRAEIDRVFKDQVLGPAGETVNGWRGGLWFGSGFQSAEVEKMGDVNVSVMKQSKDPKLRNAAAMAMASGGGGGGENGNGANSEDNPFEMGGSSGGGGGGGGGGSGQGDSGQSEEGTEQETEHVQRPPSSKGGLPLGYEWLRGLGFEAFKAEFVYALEQEVFVCRRLKTTLSPTQFNALGSHAAGGYSFGGKKSAAARFLDPPDLSRGEAPGTVVDALTWQPGKGEVVRDGNRVEFNTWRPGGLALPASGSVADADVARWLAHVAFVFDGDPAAMSVFLDWCAWLLSRPGVKVNWCPVLCGDQGTGKDLMLWPLIEFLGDHNVGTVNAHELAGSFNAGWVQSQLIVFNELATLERQALSDKLKPLIAAPPKTLTVTQKFVPSWNIPNVAVTFGMTNRPDGLLIENSDRRLWVFISSAKPKSPEYYRALVAWYRAGGAAKVARWLLDRGVSQWFDPGRCPDDVLGHKEEMRHEGRTAVMHFLVEQLAKEGGEFAGDVVVFARQLLELGQRSSTPRGVSAGINQKSVTAAFREAGFVKMGQMRIGSGFESVWIRGGASEADAKGALDEKRKAAAARETPP
jgi:hypothetical protein